MDSNSNITVCDNIGKEEGVSIRAEIGSKIEDLTRKIKVGGEKVYYSGTDSTDVSSCSCSKQITTEPGTRKMTNVLLGNDSSLIGLSPSIAGQSEYLMDLEDSLDEHSEEMSVFSPSLESSMTHKHILRHQSLPNALNPDGNLLKMPKMQSLAMSGVPELVPEIALVEPGGSNEDQNTMDTSENLEVNNSRDRVNEDSLEVEEDKKFLFETASILLKAPDLSKTLSPIGIIRQQRSYSESGIRSEDESITSQPKIFLTRKTKKLVIKLPNGDLLKGRC